MTDSTDGWRDCWHQSPGACLALGVCWFGYFVIPIGISGTILVVSIWFAPDLRAASVVQLIGIAAFYSLLPVAACCLTRWFDQKRRTLQTRLARIAGRQTESPVSVST